MDAFAVSVGKGLSLSSVRPRHMFIAGVWFGGFQALMPVAGYFLGSTFANYFTNIDHWIAFVLLSIIGGKMLYDTFTGDDEEGADADFRFKTMFVLAVATSIDALAIGVSLAFLKADIWSAIAFIGATTAAFSAFAISSS